MSSMLIPSTTRSRRIPSTVIPAGSATSSQMDDGPRTSLPSTSRTLAGAQIAGLVVGTASLLILCTIAVLCWRRRKRSAPAFPYLIPSHAIKQLPSLRRASSGPLLPSYSTGDTMSFPSVSLVSAAPNSQAVEQSHPTTAHLSASPRRKTDNQYRGRAEEEAPPLYSSRPPSFMVVTM